MALIATSLLVRIHVTILIPSPYSLFLAHSLWHAVRISGVGLYFVYLRRMTLFSFICTLLTVPHLLICYFGDSLTRAEMDPLRLLTFAAGNHRCERTFRAICLILGLVSFSKEVKIGSVTASLAPHQRHG